MLKFKLKDGNEVSIERGTVEEKLLVAIFEKFDQAREKDAGLYTMLKQAVNMILTFSKIDIKIPKGENSLEYLVAYYVGLGLDVLETTALEVDGRIVPQAKEAEDLGEKSRD